MLIGSEDPIQLIHCLASSRLTFYTRQLDKATLGASDQIPGTMRPGADMNYDALSARNVRLKKLYGPPTSRTHSLLNPGQ